MYVFEGYDEEVVHYVKNSKINGMDVSTITFLDKL